jgi:hypothetical protein
MKGIAGVNKEPVCLIFCGGLKSKNKGVCTLYPLQGKLQGKSVKKQVDY